jgi:hypothetical protein
MEDKLGGVCTQPGCHEASLDDSLFCRTHRDAHRIWSRDYHRRKSWHRILAMNIWMAAIEPLRSEKTGKLPVRYRNPLRSVTKSVTRYDDSVTHVTAA